MWYLRLVVLIILYINNLSFIKFILLEKKVTERLQIFVNNQDNISSRYYDSNCEIVSALRFDNDPEVYVMLSSSLL